MMIMCEEEGFSLNILSASIFFLFACTVFFVDVKANGL